MTAVQYIDLKNIDFVANGNPVTIKGIYNALKSTRKRLVLTNFKYGGFERRDIEGSLKYDGLKFYITQVVNTGLFVFEVSNDDTIKFKATKWSEILTA